MIKSKDRFEITKNPALVIVFIFLLIRFFLNLDFALDFNLLSFLFAAIYLIFIFMILGEMKFFSVSLILFLIIDSMIGAYFFVSDVLGSAEFYATVLVNLAVILIVVKNRDKFN